jgi:hypothetical protein
MILLRATLKKGEISLVRIMLVLVLISEKNERT